MKVSVIIPVYNKGLYVQEAVESILHGTFTDLEVIAVDDRSTDDSLLRLHAFCDPRLRIVQMEKNGGPAAAAQRGIDEAHGEYIVRMDADDIAVPDRIAKQVAFMDAHPDIGASGGRLQLFGDDHGQQPFPINSEACKARLVFGVPISQGASILRRSVLLMHGLRFDPAWPRIGEDWLFWLNMAPHTRFANLPETLIHYRRSSSNITHKRDRTAEGTGLIQTMFSTLGIPFSQEELALYLLGTFTFKRGLDARMVSKLRTWFDRLIQWNETTRFAENQAFRSEIEDRWNRLFFYLPRYSLVATMKHMQLSKDWRWTRLTYAMKYYISTRLTS
ncbi:MAG: glycosyltransferase family A protein [Flavobacteriales bacterium]